ncbi:flavin-containing monooxygenase [Micromonospora sp. NPDC048830]|uniref:flavin-containing monooxygenase n=1 Tax=Micromonospora sp. NPDC048830 TaxID=3364257 RepID=UPI00371A6E4F
MPSSPHKPGARVAVIGGGFAGVAAGRELLRRGHDVVIYEAADGPGGTWRANRFPGVEVDTPAVMYSYSFAPGNWTREFPGGAELRAYLEVVSRDEGLMPLFRFGHKVTRLVWDDAAAHWAVTVRDLATGTSRTERFTAVVSAVGLLNIPRHPDWPGREDYTGEMFHTAEWPEGIDLAGRRVAVVGTGSTAAQVVAELAGVAGHLTVFQRQPGWVDPKVGRTYTEVERARRRNPLRRRLIRWQLFLKQERRWLGGRIIRPGSGTDEQLVEACRRYLDEVFADHPELKAQLTPTSAYLGKRAVHSSTFYPALLRDDVTLVPRAVVGMYQKGLIDADGEEHVVDVVITATGFRAAEFLHGIEVIGRGGRVLAEKWGDDPMAFLGITVDEMPNFFMLYGPNTNWYAPVFGMEKQALFIGRTLDELRRRGARSVEVKPSYVAWLNRWLKRRLDSSSFAQTPNYFRSASGRVVTQWPDGASVYWLLTKLLWKRSARFES